MNSFNEHSQTFEVHSTCRSFRCPRAKQDGNSSAIVSEFGMLPARGGEVKFVGKVHLGKAMLCNSLPDSKKADSKSESPHHHSNIDKVFQPEHWYMLLAAARTAVQSHFTVTSDFYFSNHKRH